MRYRIEFEIVNPISRPEAYRGDKPALHRDDVPEKWWQPVNRESHDREDILDQRQGLIDQIARGELIRNVRCFESVTDWKELK